MSITAPYLSLGVNLPPTWTYHGCYTDYERRKLAGPSYYDASNMTQASCVAFCNTAAHPYAGVEYGSECYCGLTIGSGSSKANDSECGFSCPGNATEACGAGNRLSVFYAEALDSTRTNPGPEGTQRIGCVVDDVYKRVLAVLKASEDGMTITRCTESCKADGFSIAGVEYGRECFCGDGLGEDVVMTEEGCDMRCAGNATEFCGGAARMDVYALNITVSNPEPTTAGTPACTPTAPANPFIPNGDFEDGLTDWLPLAYNASSSAFDIGLTSSALTGCSALTVQPRPNSTSLAQHFQVSTLLSSLIPGDSYTLTLSIGHPPVTGALNPIADPKYTIRLGDALLGYGAICGFAYAACPLTGQGESVWDDLEVGFRAKEAEERLTVYLSWYNGNFGVPLFLDGASVRAGEEEGA